MTMPNVPSLDFIRAGLPGGVLPANSIDVFAARDVYASTLTPRDCNIETGGKVDPITLAPVSGTPTDAYPALLAFLTNPTGRLVLDGGFSMSKGFPLETGTAIAGMGQHTGIRMRDGANSSGAQNFPQTQLAEFEAWNPTGPQSVTMSKIYLSNFSIYRNRGTFPAGPGNCSGTTDGTLTGPSPTPTNPRGPYAGAYWLSGIVLVGVQDFTIQKIKVYDSTSYGINLYHCTDGLIDDPHIEVPDPTVLGNTDGIHHNGGCRRVKTRGGYFRTGDDPWAANVAEGDGTGGSDLTWEGSTLDNCLNFGRAHAKGASAPLVRVTVRGIKGTYQNAGFNIGLENGQADPMAEACQSISIEDCEIALTASNFRNSFVWLNGNAGSVVVDNCRWISPTQAAPFVLVGSTGSTISSLRLIDCAIHRTASGHAASYALDASVAGTGIGDLAISGFRVTQPAGANYPDIPRLVKFDGTSVGKIGLDASVKGVGTVLFLTQNSPCGGVEVKDLSHWSNDGGASISVNVFSSSALIPVSLGRYTSTNVFLPVGGNYLLSGPGVLSTGSTFPDILMADNTHYLGADHANQVCVKVGGVAKVLAYMAAGPATAFNFIDGPDSGTTGVASANFIVAPDGTATAVVTPHTTGTGTFTPTSLTWTGTADAKTFTYTPGADELATISLTNDAALGNPTVRTYVSSSAASMEDHFAVGSPGTDLTGLAPDTVQHGTDVWGGAVLSDTGGFVLKSGGGATSSGTGPNYSRLMAHVGPGDKVIDFTITGANTTAVPTFYFNYGDDNNFVSLDANAGFPRISIGTMVAGSFNGSAAIIPTPLDTGTPHTITLTIVGTTLTLALDGAPVGSAVTLPAAAGDGVVIKQQNGGAGDVTFADVKVSLTS